MAGQAPVAGPSPTAVSESTCEESKTTRRNESKDIAEIHLDFGEREVDTNIMIVKIKPFNHDWPYSLANPPTAEWMWTPLTRVDKYREAFCTPITLSLVKCPPDRPSRRAYTPIECSSATFYHRTSMRKTCTTSGSKSRDSYAGFPPPPPSMESAPPRLPTKNPASGGTAMERHQDKLVTTGLLFFNIYFAPGSSSDLNINHNFWANVIC
ncbi:hypothetical protein PCANC_19356 [Puccinia coronata f. sp. avenae]|uniref:Uncharacterized protein n=1 Tax=Puccinia coronata f. sp. avenae TaxID=200324 RepID=A0A2N5SDQ9_9BASI|nr:hypothetical protein PCANC_19356 [Puccinia coronata f. sp. avenae]PLW51425.1 hypothetical protein PCASD_00283 [Puccinia coronata f. sp. avenae]